MTTDTTLPANTPAPAETPAADNPDDIFELAKALALAAVIALTIRTFLFEPFNIPSGSLLPTLMVGDYLFVEKYSYGYSKYSFPLDLMPMTGRIFGSEPARGDVAVFRQPKHPEIDYIKRIIGLPGDTVQVRGGTLYINSQPVRREYKGREHYKDATLFSVYNRYIETLPNGVKHYIYEISDNERFDNTPVYTVPEGYYFAMGDNRDSSLDSRAQDDVGFIPYENLVGRAFFIFLSTEGIGKTCEREGSFAFLKTLGCELVEWPKAVRYNRILKRVNVF
jgi:signal peptidase I